MPASYDWPTFDAMVGGMAGLIEVDARAEPLMQRWADVIVEGNRRGVLSGLDGHDQPMPPLKYRNTGKIRKRANRQVPEYGTTRYESTGAGPYATGLHDNLTAAQYEQLTGPRLAPRLENSRVIKDLMTEIRYFPAEHKWEVVGAWDAVMSVKGVKFLPFHFNGEGRLPRYDLRPVRPRDLAFCVNALRAFLKDEFFVTFG